MGPVKLTLDVHSPGPIWYITRSLIIRQLPYSTKVWQIDYSVKIDPMYVLLECFNKILYFIYTILCQNYSFKGVFSVL